MSHIKGRVVKDAEVKQFEEGREVVNFTVAVNESYEKRNGEKVEKVEYFNCAYWFDSGVATSLTKGIMVEVSGWISATVYQKGDDHRAQLTLQVQSVKFPFMPKKKDSQGDFNAQEEGGAATQPQKSKGGRKPAAKNRQPQSAVAIAGEVSDDLPF